IDDEAEALFGVEPLDGAVGHSRPPKTPLGTAPRQNQFGATDTEVIAEPSGRAQVPLAPNDSWWFKASRYNNRNRDCNWNLGILPAPKCPQIAIRGLSAGANSSSFGSSPSDNSIIVARVMRRFFTLGSNMKYLSLLLLSGYVGMLAGCAGRAE